MAGIPPLIGFFSKQLVLYSALQNGYYFISVLAIIVSVISCSYYLQIIKLLFTISPAENSTPLPLGPAHLSVASEPSPRGSDPKEGADLVNFATRALDPRYREEDSIGSSSPLAVANRLGEGSSGVGSYEINLTNTHSYLISTLTFTILLFFIKPSLILNSTQLLSLSLFYI